MTSPECFLTSLFSLNFRWRSRAVPFLHLGGPLPPRGSTYPAFFETFRPLRLHVRLCNTRKRKGLSRKHEIPKARKEYQQLGSIGISILDTDYTDGHGLGSAISEICVENFLSPPEGG